MIVVYAPYGRNDITAAALRVAELCRADGADVLYMTEYKEMGISAYWDRRVRTSALIAWPEHVEACIMFGHDLDLVEAVKILAPDAMRVLVPTRRYNISA